MKYYDAQINWKGIGDYLSAARTISEHGTSNTSGPKIYCLGLAIELAIKFYLWDKNGSYPGTHNLETLAFQECHNISFSEEEIVSIKHLNNQYLDDGEFPYPARYRPVAGGFVIYPTYYQVEDIISKILKATTQPDLLDQILTR